MEPTVILMLDHVCDRIKHPEGGSGEVDSGPKEVKLFPCWCCATNNKATKKEHKTDKHRHQPLTCLLIMASKHKPVISCGYRR